MGLPKGHQFDEKRTYADKNRNLKKIRAIHSASLDLSIAMEIALKTDYQIKAKDKQIVIEFLKDLNSMKRLVSKHQAKMEKSIIESCGGSYQGDE